MVRFHISVMHGCSTPAQQSQMAITCWESSGAQLKFFGVQTGRASLAHCCSTARCHI